MIDENATLKAFVRDIVSITQTLEAEESDACRRVFAKLWWTLAKHRDNPIERTSRATVRRASGSLACSVLKVAPSRMEEEQLAMWRAMFKPSRP